jgi:hypothetical protein
VERGVLAPNVGHGTPMVRCFAGSMELSCPTPPSVYSKKDRSSREVEVPGISGRFIGPLDGRDFIAINRAKIYPVLWDKQRLG